MAPKDVHDHYAVWAEREGVPTKFHLGRTGLIRKLEDSGVPEERYRSKKVLRLRFANAEELAAVGVDPLPLTIPEPAPF
jgi:hypothetical protein